MLHGGMDSGYIHVSWRAGHLRREESRLLGWLYPSESPFLNSFPDDLKFPDYSPTSLFEGREGQEKKQEPFMELSGSENLPFPTEHSDLLSLGPCGEGHWSEGPGEVEVEGRRERVLPVTLGREAQERRAALGVPEGREARAGLVWRFCWRRCAPGGRVRAALLSKRPEEQG